MDAYKYQRTLHLPWSRTVSKDDKLIKDIRTLISDDIVVLEKMDGENANLYTKYLHARSIDFGYHESRDWLKRFHASISHNIPDNIKLCGENVFAKHSIFYENLMDYFLLFSIWDENKVCLSWDETVEWAELLDVRLVPVLYRGPWDEKLLRDLPGKMDLNKQEGYVIRPACQFKASEFSKKVAKYVRPNHVQTDEHWMKRKVIPNLLREGCERDI
jgi:RNA ligase.